MNVQSKFVRGFNHAANSHVKGRHGSREKFGFRVNRACRSTVSLSFAKALRLYPYGCGRSFAEESQMRRVVLGAALVLLACGSPTVPRSASTQGAASGSGDAVSRTEPRAALAVAAPANGATPATAASTQVDLAGSAVTQSCTLSGAASSPGPTQITSQAATDDIFTLTFDRGVSQFEATPQSSPNFTADPSGLPVVLQGSAGVRIVLRGLHFPGDPSGPSSFTSGGSLVDEIRRIGDL